MASVAVWQWRKPNEEIEEDAYQLQSPNNGQLLNKIQNTWRFIRPEWSTSTKKKQKYQPIGHLVMDCTGPLGFRERREAIGYLLPCLIYALHNEKDSY